MHRPSLLGSAARGVLAVAALTACAGDLPTGMDAERYPLAARTPAPTVTAAQVGRSIYFDPGMSRNNNQACASCHAPDWGFTGPASGIVSQNFAFFEGSIAGRFGNRKPPSAAYASFTPARKFTRAEGYAGGLFWDSRASGTGTLTPIQEQALGPFRADKEHAFSRVCILWEINKKYASQFDALSPVKLSSIPFAKIGADAAARDAYCHTGTADLPDNPAGFTATELSNLTSAYNYVGVLVGAFEASSEVNRFASKWDDVQAGRATFTADEARGATLFGDHCETCHSSTKLNQPQVFNDHGYYNLGLPRNPLRASLVDRGLGAVVNNAAYDGFFRNATVRNVDKRAFPGGAKAYMHNGVFTSLEQVVHFYNTRDLKACPAGVTFVRFPTVADAASAATTGVCWPTPDFPATMSKKLGNMGLTAADEAALVAFMRTLTDR